MSFRSAWLSYKGELCDYFSDPIIRDTVIKAWNKEKSYPSLRTYFSDGNSFVNYFDGQVGHRERLIQLMFKNHYIPLFGLEGLNELDNEVCRLLGKSPSKFEEKSKSEVTT